jgi:hypothetical protein
MSSRRTQVIPTLVLSLGLVAALAACTPSAPSSGGDGDAGDGGSGSGDGGSSSFVVLAGSGSYAIGTEAPYGGYQLKGEPDEQPDGCTWSILDADGGTTFTNEGPYVFITDIKEAVTFVTDGCPDWEQFE